MIKSVMLNANQARAKADSDLVIFHEVRDIEEAILTAISIGQFQIILNSTRMTSTLQNDIATSRLYYSTWVGAASDRARERQMSSVIQYFFDLGYSIERRTNNVTGDTFNWHVYW
jgi:hypothetical protein